LPSKAWGTSCLAQQGVGHFVPCPARRGALRALPGTLPGQ
jgi:hypothetical protein